MYGFTDGMPVNDPLGAVECKEGRVVAFPNLLQHRVNVRPSIILFGSHSVRVSVLPAMPASSAQTPALYELTRALCQYVHIVSTCSLGIRSCAATMSVLLQAVHVRARPKSFNCQTEAHINLVKHFNASKVQLLHSVCPVEVCNATQASAHCAQQHQPHRAVPCSRSACKMPPNLACAPSQHSSSWTPTPE
ncbi:MAG: DUF4246 domain-containing protein [Akkermansiaceae bacterium]|nr:DUF4246 domain-containing protein [Akkermansiaceae bacterium]